MKKLKIVSPKRMAFSNYGLTSKRELSKVVALNEDIICVIDGAAVTIGSNNVPYVILQDHIIDICGDEDYCFLISSNRCVFYLYKANFRTVCSLVFHDKTKLIYSSLADVITESISAYHRGIGVICIISRNHVTIFSVISQQCRTDDGSIHYQPLVEDVSYTSLKYGNMHSCRLWPVDDMICVLVTTGSHVGLLFWKISKNMNDHGQQTWGKMATKPDGRLLMNHRCWITSLSSGNSPYYAAGDADGNVFLFKVSPKHHDVKLWFEEKQVSNCPVMSIMTCEKTLAMWIGFANGEIVMLTIDNTDLELPKLIRSKRIRTHGITAVTYFSWRHLHATGTLHNTEGNTEMGGDDNRLLTDGWAGILVSVSAHDFAIWTSKISDAVTDILHVWPEIDAVPRLRHGSITCCTVLAALGLIVTAGQGSEVFVWSLSDGEEVTSVDAEDYDFTCICGHEDSIAQTALLITGHRCGVVTVFQLVAQEADDGPTSEDEVAPQPIASTTAPSVQTLPAYFNLSKTVCSTSSTTGSGPECLLPWKLLCKSKASYAPSAVSDVIISPDGHVLLVVHARSTIYVHSMQTQRAVMQLQLTADVYTISLTTPGPYVANASTALQSSGGTLSVLLQGPKQVTVVAALTGRELQCIDLDVVSRHCSALQTGETRGQGVPRAWAGETRGVRVVKSKLWRVPGDDGRFILFCVTDTGNIVSLDHNQVVTLISKIPGDASSPGRGSASAPTLATLAIGMCISEHATTPVLAVWTALQILVLHITVNLQENTDAASNDVSSVTTDDRHSASPTDDTPGVGRRTVLAHNLCRVHLTRESNYEVDNFKARVVNVQFLDRRIRDEYLRIIVSLSDGFAFVALT